MIKNFSLILPTRGRLYLVNRLLDSIIETTSNLDLIEIVLCIDEDDTESRHIIHPLLSVRNIVIPRKNSGMGDIFKLCCEKNTSRYIILINDDVIFRTHNWDIRVLEAFSHFPDDVALVYLNDLYYGSKLSSFPVLSRTVCDLMSGVCPSGYLSHGIDSHIFDIFERLSALGFERRKYLPQVVFEHMHYGVTLASYEGNYCPDHTRDQLLFSSLADERQQVAAKMARYVQTCPRKESLAVLPSVSIIMHTRDNLSKSGRACLEEIRQDNRYRKLNYEIIIVSNGLPERNTISCLDKDLRSKIRLVSCESESTAEILHKAAIVSNADYLVFLNDRCLPVSGWLVSLLETAAGDAVGIVGSKWLNPRNGRVEHIGLSFYQDDGLIKETCLYKGLPSNHPVINKPREFQAVKIPGMLIKKDVFLQIDKSEDDLNGLEHLALCLKVRDLGKSILYSPQAALYCDCPEFIADTSGNSAICGNFLQKLKIKLVCDLEEQLAEDGFILYSSLQGHYVCPADLCLSGENK